MCLFGSILEPVLDNNIQSKIILNIDKNEYYEIVKSNSAHPEKGLR